MRDSLADKRKRYDQATRFRIALYERNASDKRQCKKDHGFHSVTQTRTNGAVSAV